MYVYMELKKRRFNENKKKTPMSGKFHLLHKKIKSIFVFEILFITLYSMTKFECSSSTSSNVTLN